MSVGNSNVSRISPIAVYTTAVWTTIAVYTTAVWTTIAVYTTAVWTTIVVYTTAGPGDRSHTPGPNSGNGGQPTQGLR